LEEPVSPPCEPDCRGCASLRGAAVALAAERGPDSLDARELGARAGLAPGPAARHYRSAQACLLAAYDEAAHGVLADFRAPFAGAASWREGLRLAIEGLLARLAERQDEARLLFLEALRGSAELRRHRDRARRDMVALLAGEHERRRGSERLEEIHFELLQGAMFQAIAAAVSDGPLTDVDELAGELLTLASVFEPIAA
jgi:AcrR family transcriptional regulator